MFIFVTLSDGKIFIHHLAAVRTKADRRVWAPVIKVEALFYPLYHLFFLSIQDRLTCPFTFSFSSMGQASAVTSSVSSFTDLAKGQ